MSTRCTSMLLARFIGVGATVAAPAAGMAQTTLRIPTQDCARLVAHTPAPDVAFRSGVDAHGKPVAPADLPGSRFAVEEPNSIEFEVSFNPLKGAGARRFPRSELVVGRVVVDLKTGRARFNGRLLGGPEHAELAQKCRRALDKGG